jgi:hypothetical protein
MAAFVSGAGVEEPPPPPQPDNANINSDNPNNNNSARLLIFHSPDSVVLQKKQQLILIKART